MKPPPLLLGATLLFWGWQSEFLVVGAILGVVLESAQLIRTRWEFSDEDFARIWTFCALLLLASALYAFTANEGPASFGGFFSDANPITTTRASSATARTASAMIRWLPMLFFPFLAAQTFSTREAIPLTVISLIARRRWKKLTPADQSSPLARLSFHIGYPYFAATLLASSFHPAEDKSFFWGLAGLLTWMLWAHRTRRVTLVVWVGLVALAVALGFAGQRGIGSLAGYLQEQNPQWLTRFLRRNIDPSHSRTALGQIGDIKTSGRIVIRLRPKAGSAPPEYLREASYRVFKSPGWFAGSLKDDFEVVGEDPPNSASFPLLPGKTNSASINIACYLDGTSTNGSPEGLLPLPTGSGRLAIIVPPMSCAKAAWERWWRKFPGLVLFDALFGPGLTMDLLLPQPRIKRRPVRAGKRTSRTGRSRERITASRPASGTSAAGGGGLFCSQVYLQHLAGTGSWYPRHHAAEPFPAGESQGPLRVFRHGHGVVVAPAQNSRALCRRLRRP